MADFKADYWGEFGFWESLVDSSDNGEGEIEHYLARMSAVSDLYVITSGNNYLKIGFYPEGSMELWGSGFESGDDVSVTKIKLDFGQTSIQLTGSLDIYESYYGELFVTGNVNKVTLNSPSATGEVTGQMYLHADGTLDFISTYETYGLSSGLRITSRTDVNGDYYQFTLSYDNKNLTVDGSWPGNDISDSAALTQYDDRYYGTDKSDLFYLSGNSGNDIVFGGEGIDMVKLDASRNSIEFDLTGSEIILRHTGASEDTDTLYSVERLIFDDQSIALDIDGSNSAGGIYRAYQAAFSRDPDFGGLGYWIDRADNGASAVQMAEEFVWSQEFQALYNVTTTDNYLTGNDINAVVNGFYQNVFGREADQGGLDFYTSTIQGTHETAPQRTVGRVLAEMADSTENRANVLAEIENGMQYDLWLG